MDVAIKKIKTRFDEVQNQIAELVEHKYVFQRFRLYSEERKMNLDQVYLEFFKFIAFNFRDLAIIKLYRQVDERNDVTSLINLLEEIKEKHACFNKSWFISQYPKMMQYVAIQDYKQFKGRTGLSKNKIENDIQNLRKSVKGRKTKYVRGGRNKETTPNSLARVRHKRGAHYDASVFDSKASINDLYHSIDLMEQMVLKYNLLLNQSGMESLLPSNIDDYYNFSEIFKRV